MVAEAIRRGDVILVAMGTTKGSEIRRTRPCVVVSPDEINAFLPTLIVAPMTTGSHQYPYRVPCRFAGKSGHVVLDQLRAVDQHRMIRRLGHLPAATVLRVLTGLQAMFAP